MAAKLKTLRLTEAAFQAQVIQLAHMWGWRVACFRPVRVQRADGTVYHETPVGADGKGWPDLVLVRGRRILAAELKVGRNVATPEQRLWIDALNAAGVTACVWRPGMWDAIVAELE